MKIFSPILFAAALLLSWHANAVTLTMNVANAPAWVRSTSYIGPIWQQGTGFGNRVLAGPGYTVAGGFTNGSAIYLWAATNTTSGTSSSTGNGPQSCPSPWLTNPSSPTTVTDGTVTWQCMVQVDYTDAPSSVEDSGTAWTANGKHTLSSIIEANGNLYMIRMDSFNGLMAYNSPTFSCTSKSSGSGPSGTGSLIDDGDVTTMTGTVTNGAATITGLSSTSGLAVGEGVGIFGSGIWPAPGEVNAYFFYIGSVDSSSQVTVYANGAPSNWTGASGSKTISFGYGCQWQYLMALPYTSQRGFWPQQVYSSGGLGRSFMQGAYTTITFNFWHGGAAQTEYPSTTVYNHQTLYGDAGPFCQPPNQANLIWSCGANGITQVVTLQAAPGDGICNHALSGLPLAYNPNNGVAFHGTGSSNGLYFGDSSIIVSCLQGKADNGLGITGDTGTSDMNQYHTDNDYVLNSIIDSNGTNGATHCDGACVYGNDLIVFRGTTANMCGICTKYNVEAYNSTIIATASGADATAIATYDPIFDVSGGLKYNSVVAVGWKHWFAYDPAASGVPSTANSSNNATDLANTDSGASVTFPSIGIALTTQPIVTPGTGCGGNCYSLTSSALFVNLASDWRLSLASPLRGGGSSYSSTSGFTGQWAGNPNNAADVEGTPRPQGGAYDIGAYQTFAVVPSPRGGGRVFPR